MLFRRGDVERAPLHLVPVLSFHVFLFLIQPHHPPRCGAASSDRTVASSGKALRNVEKNIKTI